MKLSIIEVLDIDKNSSASKDRMGIDGQYISFYIKEKIEEGTTFVWGTYQEPQLVVVKVTPRKLDDLLYHYKIDCQIYTNDPCRVFLPSYMLRKGTFLIHKSW